jgi:small conductance mechanosensitive channel
VPLEQFNVRREFLRRIKLAFDREGIEIPFPHRKLVYEAQERKSA